MDKAGSVLTLKNNYIFYLDLRKSLIQDTATQAFALSTVEALWKKAFSFWSFFDGDDSLSLC